MRTVLGIGGNENESSIGSKRLHQSRNTDRVHGAVECLEYRTPRNEVPASGFG